MPRIVDADNDNGKDRNINISERIERGNAIAEILRALPWFVWAAPLWILAGLILIAIGTQGIGGFSHTVMAWLSIIPWIAGIVSVVKGMMWAYNTYHKIRSEGYNRRLLSYTAAKAEQAVIGAKIGNVQKQAEANIALQIPDILVDLASRGIAFKYSKGGNLEVFGLAGQTTISQVAGQQQQIAGPAAPLALGAGDTLPTSVLYEDIRSQVPKGYILVGISIKGIEVKEGAVGAMVWIVGLSGTGKTSTTVLRVEERANDDHYFLGTDPHWFKDDSLFHSIYETVDGQPGAYKERFLMPMACTPEESKVVLQTFLDEFNGRKSGRIPKPWRKITLLIDEVGAQMDPTTPEEEEIAKMLPSIARICGQEARNFGMGGVFISQQATGLAWLRKMALMVIVHQLLMESEKKLACNGNAEVVKDMENWPVGRTYVYGVGFQKTGPIVVQQPYFAGRRTNSAAPGDDHQGEEDESIIVDADKGSDVEPGDDHPQEEQTTSNVIPALAGDLRTVYDACQQLQSMHERISSRAIERLTNIDKDKANTLLNRLAELGYIPSRKNKAV